MNWHFSLAMLLYYYNSIKEDNIMAYTHDKDGEMVRTESRGNGEISEDMEE